MPEQILQRDVRGGVATLTLNSPGNLNALSEAMIDALRGDLDDISRSGAVRCVILKGSGNAFCAGHDLKELTQGRQSEDGGKDYFHTIFKKCSAMMRGILAMPQPVIAQVHGVAAAAGCQLVATCDLAVASADARFGVNGVNIGLFCSTPMVALSRNIPRKQAIEMLTTGRFVSADEALNLGLINKVAPAGDLDNETAALAAKVASKLQAAVKIGKRAFYDQLQMPIDQAYAYTGEVMVKNMLHGDTAEGISAFLEKRAPAWSE